MRKFLISLTAIAVGVPAFAQYTPVKKEDAVTYTGGSIGVSSSSAEATITATGYEAKDARLILDADEGDDAADTWTVESEAADNDLSILNSTSERVQLTAAGALTLKGGDLTVDGGVSGTVYSVVVQGGEASDARLSLDADDGDDNADTWFIESEAADNDLSFVNHTTERMKLTSAGALTVGAAVDAASYTCDAGSGLDAQSAGAVDVGAATATSVLLGATDCFTSVLGALKLQYVNKTANYTNSVNDCVISYDTSAATTNTLPEASTALGRVFVICLQDDDGDLVVMTDGTDKFDGSNDILTFADAGDSCVLMATAANVYTIIVNVGGTLSN